MRYLILWDAVILNVCWEFSTWWVFIVNKDFLPPEVAKQRLEDGSVGKVFALQAWQPESGSSEPQRNTERVEHSGTSVWKPSAPLWEMGCSARIAGSLYAVSLACTALKRGFQTRRKVRTHTRGCSPASLYTLWCRRTCTHTHKQLSTVYM